MNYLLQREEIPTRYFKISSAAEFNKIVKQTNKDENFPAILLQQFVNYICKYGCTLPPPFLGRPALYYIQDVGSKILWDKFTVPYYS